MEETNIIALEIGSSKIKGALGSTDSTGTLSVKAVEEEKITDIVRYGCIRNVVETAAAVRNVIARLEARIAPRKIEGVYVSLGGRSLSALSVDIERRYANETEITKNIIDDITDEALKRTVPERSVIDALPRELRVDGAPAPRPVGMFGRNIQASLNLISCRTQLIKNLSHVICERLGLKVNGTFVRPLAEADLVLYPDEKKLGCVLVDFGAETTTVAIYKQGVLVHLAVLPMGSRNITRDITTMNMLEDKAEELKIAFGNASSTPGDLGGLRPADGTDTVMLNNYVSARAGEIMLNIAEQIKYAGLTPEKLPRGIVAVGRGARLQGLSQRLSNMLSGMNVRVGTPTGNLHILDGRIHADDAVDVISILAAAARKEAKECLSATPKPIEKPVERYTETQGQPYGQPYQPSHQGQPDRQPYGVRAAQQPAYQPPHVDYDPVDTREDSPRGGYQQGGYHQQGGYQPAAAEQPRQPRQPEQPRQPQGETERRQPNVAPKPKQPVRPEPKKPSAFQSLLGSLKERVAGILTDNVYEEEDERSYTSADDE